MFSTCHKVFAKLSPSHPQERNTLRYTDIHKNTA
jgi:hypothetical protein